MTRAVSVFKVSIDFHFLVSLFGLLLEVWRRCR